MVAKLYENNKKKKSIKRKREKENRKKGNIWCQSLELNCLHHFQSIITDRQTKGQRQTYRVAPLLVLPYVRREVFALSLCLSHIPSTKSTNRLFIWSPRLTKMVLIYAFYSNFRRNSLYYNAIHDFSVWLRTDFNPDGINRFRCHTGNKITELK